MMMKKSSTTTIYLSLLLLMITILFDHNFVVIDVVDAFSFLHHHNHHHYIHHKKNNNCQNIVNNNAVVESSINSSFPRKKLTRLSARKNNNKNENENNHHPQDFVDVDFERVVVSEPEDDEGRTATTTTSTTTSTTTTKTENDVELEDDDNNGPASKAWKQQRLETTTTNKNILELALDFAKENDPSWDETRIPFCRPTINDLEDDIDTAISGKSTGSDEYIDTKLAFTVDLDGTKYGIAVPYDDPVAIVIEKRRSTTNKNTSGRKKKKKKNGGKSSSIGGGGGGFQQQQDVVESQIEYIDPDSYFDDLGQGGGEETESTYKELMEIMASQVQEHLGDEYVLRKTPKVLTISGGLSKLTDEWERKLMPDPISVQELLDDVSDHRNKKGEEDKLLNEFYDFMKEELGDEEFHKTMNDEDPPLSKEDEELMQLFDIPGLGTQKDDLEGLQELIDSISNDLDSVVDDDDQQDDDEGNKNSSISTTSNIQQELKQFEMDTDGMSLKLISFNPDGKQSYSLVKLLEPYVLVGRYAPLIDDDDENSYVIMNETDDDDDEDDDDDDDNPSIDEVLRFELLSPEEERLVIPKLEELCRNDLKEKGLSFQTP